MQQSGRTYIAIYINIKHLQRTEHSAAGRKNGRDLHKSLFRKP